MIDNQRRQQTKKNSSFEMFAVGRRSLLPGRYNRGFSLRPTGPQNPYVVAEIRFVVPGDRAFLGLKHYEVT